MTQQTLDIQSSYNRVAAAYVTQIADELAHKPLDRHLLNWFAERVAVLREFKRLLCPGGALLLAFHIGEDVVHLDEWWGQAVALDFVFFQIDEMQTYLTTAGFEIEAVIERAPYADAEHPSRRAYICAGNPIK